MSLDIAADRSCPWTTTWWEMLRGVISSIFHIHVSYSTTLLYGEREPLEKYTYIYIYIFIFLFSTPHPNRETFCRLVPPQETPPLKRSQWLFFISAFSSFYLLDRNWKTKFQNVGFLTHYTHTRRHTLICFVWPRTYRQGQHWNALLSWIYMFTRISFLGPFFSFVSLF